VIPQPPHDSPGHIFIGQEFHGASRGKNHS
jgi:hypothetical protein